MKILTILSLYFLVVQCESYKILAIFPHDGRSHNLYFTALVEELATRKHDVTVINYNPVSALPTLRQISLQDKETASDHVNIEEHLKFLSISDFSVAYDEAQSYKYLANKNCKKLMNNREVQELITSAAHFDVVIVEQFVTDCGLAVAYKLNAPAIGMTAHVLMPWTYSRLGAPNNPAYVPNHFFASGKTPNLWNKIKGAIINFGMNIYYTHVIQTSDQEIVNEVYPDIPLLEDLGRNMSLIMINQYFPLTGPRLYSSNVIEVGGMHIKENVQIADQVEYPTVDMIVHGVLEIDQHWSGSSLLKTACALSTDLPISIFQGLQLFLDNANKGVVYISFGTVASNFSRNTINEIKKFVKENSNMLFIWKTDLKDWEPPRNVFIGKWMPQKAILCHTKVVAFITHSGMLGTSEALHCGVPIVGVPLFGDQHANAQSAVETGLGVTVDILTLNQHVLEDALNMILKEKYKNKAKELSRVWKDRPLSPMDTAIFWTEYVARNKGAVNLKPPTVDMPLYQYLMLDVIFVVGSVFVLILFTGVKSVSLVMKKSPIKKSVKKDKRKKNE